MGTYGTATGLVLAIPAAGLPGKLMGLSGGEPQAYFDSDGKIKWAGGLGYLDENGAQVEASALIDPTEPNGFILVRSGTPIGGLYGYWNGVSSRSIYVHCKPFGIQSKVIIYAEQNNPYDDDEYVKLRLEKAAYGYATDDLWELKAVRGAFFNRIYGTQAHEDFGAIGLEISVEGVAHGFYLGRGAILDMPLSMSNEHITDLADAVAATDALNRQSGDARYAGISTGTIDGGVW